MAVIRDILSREEVKLEIVNKKRWKRFEAPLHKAAEHGRDEVIRVLLEAGAQVNSYLEHLDTPLHWAVRCNKPDTVRLLLAKGANAKLNGKNFSMCYGTPLSWARQLGYKEIIDILREHDRKDTFTHGKDSLKFRYKYF